METVFLAGRPWISNREAPETSPPTLLLARRPTPEAPSHGHFGVIHAQLLCLDLTRAGGTRVQRLRAP